MNPSNDHARDGSMALPFVGRERELSRLCRLHTQRRHVLLISPAGVGKSALVAQLREALELAVGGAGSPPRQVCADLETALGLPPADLRLIPRQQRLLRAIANAGRTVVFDNVGRTTPRLSSFLEGALRRAPVWITTRSDRARDIGHFWPLLARFERIELRPFTLTETRELIHAAIEQGLATPATSSIVAWLHHQAGGNPHRLRGFLEVLRSGDYDLSTARRLRLLKLDCGIRELNRRRAAENAVS